jgi:thiamine biosynthesis lipoprotein
MRRLIPFLLAVLIGLSACTPADESKYSCAKVEGTSQFRCSALLTGLGATMGGQDIAVSFIAYVSKKSSFDPLVDLVRTETTRLNHLFDKYTAYDGLNNVKTINDKAGIEAVTVDQALIDLLLLSREWTTITQGTFDVSLGAVLDIWHDYRDDGREQNENGQPGSVPTVEELTDAAQYTGWSFVEIDDVANTVYLTHERASLDLGGISKGYTTELVSIELRKAGLTNFLLSFGGSSSVIQGEKPDGKDWIVGVRAPIRGNPWVELDKAYFQSDFTLSSSGDDQNYYYADNEVYYHHLIDPSTNFPADHGVRSVTVFIKDDAAIAEALSKALYILPLDEAYAFIENYNTQHPEAELAAIWIVDNDQIPTGDYPMKTFTQGTSNGTPTDAPFTLIYTPNLEGQTNGY